MSSFGSGSSPGTSGAKPAIAWLSSGNSDFAGKSGVAVDQPHGWVFEFKEAVFRFRHFARPQDALEAAGLSE